MLGNRKDNIGMIIEGLQHKNAVNERAYSFDELVSAYIYTRKGYKEGDIEDKQKRQEAERDIKATGLSYDKAWVNRVLAEYDKRKATVQESVEELLESLREDDMMGWEEKEVIESNSIFDSYNSDFGAIDEAKMVTFDGQANPKFGWAVIMAGGAGSGKGYMLKNRVMLDAKVIDVDELKKGYVKLAKKGKIDGDDGNYDFKNTKDVSALHAKVDDLGWKDKVEKNFFATANPDRLPNIVYDITGSKASKLAGLGKMLHEMGYKVSLVWVVTNRQVAMIQNLTRDRVVAQELFHDIHNKVNDTIFPFLKSADAKYYNEAWVIFSSPETTKSLSAEQKKEFEKFSAVKMLNTGGKFDIPKDVEMRVYRTLGDNETNPDNPEVYQNYSDALKTLEPYKKTSTKDGKTKVSYSGIDKDNILKK